MKTMLKSITMPALLLTLSMAAGIAELSAEPPFGATEMTNDVAKVWARGRGKDSQKWPLPVTLFAGNLSNAEFKRGAWMNVSGVISPKGGGELWTKENYGNFALTLDFCCAEGASGGVLLRCGNTADWLNNSVKVQILQGEAPNPRQATGAIFNCLAPRRVTAVKAGEWQRMLIIASGKDLTVRLNGEEIIKMNLDDWNEAGKNPDGSDNPLATALKDFPHEGRVGLQSLDSQVEFRNVRIESL